MSKVTLIDADLIDALADAVAERVAARLPDPAADEWLTTREAAAYVKRSVNALHRLTAGGRIPCHQQEAGGRLLFRRSELDDWLGG